MMGPCTRPAGKPRLTSLSQGGASVCQTAGISAAGGQSIGSTEVVHGRVALGLVHPDP